MLEHGGLDIIEETYWSIERLKDNIRIPYPLHLAAKNGELKYLPQGCLNTKTLETLDNDGQTAYHNAITNYQLHKIPKGLINQTALLRPNSLGVSSITSLVNQCIGWGNKELNPPLKKDTQYALKFLNREELRKLQESGIKKLEDLCRDESKRRITEIITKKAKPLEIM